MRFLPVAVLLVSLPAVARAQDEEGCDDVPSRRPLVVTPTPGGVGATLEAPVRVRYSPGYFDDPTVRIPPEESLYLWRCEDGDSACESGDPVSGGVEVIGDELVFRPVAPFEPDTLYGGIARGVDGDIPFTFRTGRFFDMGPPEFGGILKVGSDWVEHECDAPEGGYRIDVKVDRAVDDGPGGDIEYFLYLTRGPEVEAPQLRARQRNFSGEDGIPMAFVLEPSEAVSPICIAVHAVDGVGNVAESDPHCFDPIEGNFFEPLCAVSAPGTASGARWALLGILPIGLLIARRRRTC